jgi:hypothetical protein
MDTIAIISLTVGLMSLAVSIVFFFLARKTEKTNSDILDNINKAIKEWQGRIMDSAIEMLESRTEIMAKRKYLEDAKATQDFCRNISENIKYIIEHHAPGEDSNQ